MVFISYSILSFTTFLPFAHFIILIKHVSHSFPRLLFDHSWHCCMHMRTLNSTRMMVKFKYCKKMRFQKAQKGWTLIKEYEVYDYILMELNLGDNSYTIDIIIEKKWLYTARSNLKQLFNIWTNIQWLIIIRIKCFDYI